MTAIDIYIDADGTPVNQRASRYTDDDFHAPQGERHWDLTGTGATIANATSGTDHPGISLLSTDTTNGHTATLTLYDFAEDQTQSAEFIFRPTFTTTGTLRIGLLDSHASPQTGVAVEYDTNLGDTALSLVKYVGGVRTVGATIAIAGDWYRMNWSRTGSGTGTLVVNDLTADTNQTYSVSGLAAAALWNAGIYIKTLAASARTCYIDWFLAVQSGMSR